MKKMQMFLAASAAVVLLTASGARAGDTPLTTTRVAFGMNRPIGVFHAPGDFSRVFVTEKRGVIRIIKDGVLLVTPFMDINAVVGGSNSVNSEQGLLGLAFHPDYQSNGFFYVNYTNNGGTTTIARYSVTGDPDVADPGTADVLLLIGQPQGNHNGGWIDFGPNDGYLYIATGDGGGAFDQHGQFGNGQNLNTLLGKMLRIDIDGDDFPGNPNADYAIPPDNPFADGGASPEIWAYGLRNPWRNSFDTANGDLYIGDVGQGAREEIDYQPASSSGGENYGWRCMEGLICTGLSGCVCNSDELTDPIHTYTHGFGISITGGHVYRGCAIPDLRGTYFFGDYGSARIWSFRYDGTNMTEFQERTAELAPGGGLFISNLASFGTDAYGEIYICDQSGGEVFKLIPDTGGPLNDCNNNGREDGCETADGSAADCELDEVPDDCQPVRICQGQGAEDQTRPFTGYIDPRAESSDGETLDLGITALTLVFSEEVRDIKGTELTANAFSLRATGIGFGVDQSQAGGTASAAFGLGNVSLNPAGTELTIHVEHSLATVTAGHIHRAPPGQSGPVVFPFADASSPIDEVWALTPDDVNDLNAGLLYVNLHSAAFPGGEIRGQIVPVVIDSVDTSANPVVNVTLSRPLSLKEWTTLEAAVENLAGEPIENAGDLGPGVTELDRVDVGALPANVNQDDNVTPFDLLVFRQFVNGVIAPQNGTLQDFTDIDRNGATTPFDLLAFRQLINGITPATMSWNFQSMRNAQP